MTETETYIRVLNGLHEELLNALDGLGADALDWRPPAPQANTTFVLATHILDSEAYWIQEAIAGTDTGGDNIAYMGDKRTDHITAAGTDLAAWRDGLTAIHVRNMQVLRGLTRGGLERPVPTWAEDRPARWAIQHVIDHNSRHLGQIEVTRGLWEQLNR